MIAEKEILFSVTKFSHLSWMYEKLEKKKSIPIPIMMILTVLFASATAMHTVGSALAKLHETHSASKKMAGGKVPKTVVKEFLNTMRGGKVLVFLFLFYLAQLISPKMLINLVRSVKSEIVPSKFHLRHDPENREKERYWF